MKERKYLFLANGTKPEQKQYESKEPYRISNFGRVAIEVAEEEGCEVYVGINRKFANEMNCDHPNIKLRNVEIYRNPFNIQEMKTAYRNVMKILRENKFQMIHCNTPIGGMLGRICGKKAGVKKVIYTAHGFHFYKGAPVVNWLAYYPIERILAHYTDVLITMNQEDYQRAKKFHLRKNGKVYYVPGVGIDIDEFRCFDVDKKEIRKSLGLLEEEFVLIVMGDLVKGKNHETLIRAVADCPKQVKLLICGQGVYRTELENLVKELGLEKQVYLLGYRTDIKALLKSSDAFVFASYREGLSRAVMEAMACGLPAVISDIRGNNELIDENGGFLVQPTDEIGFAKKIKILMADENMRKAMGIYNLKKIQKFSCDEVREAMKKIYRESLET